MMDRDQRMYVRTYQLSKNVQMAKEKGPENVEET